MFYSQFILAKKGPLGTIWIAAHLERKLRKNQVADTDIGDSVDSIISPDIPIALRLSSHLLLGVVRIYSRKVNYLFHDCSETLLKVKQAFRSTVVDLPPEESTAPYHSITLPETFGLEDFVLPDTAILNGNFVDHHVSTREQITLQDSVEGTELSTLQFGLDERFGDGDAPQIGLDLDEELFLDRGLSDQNVTATLGSEETQERMEIAGLSEIPFTPMDTDDCHDGATPKGTSMDDSLGKPYTTLDSNIGAGFSNMHGYNVQTPDLNEMVFGNIGAPSEVLDNMDVSYNANINAPYIGPHENAEAPSTPGLVEKAIPANIQEAAILSPQGIENDIVPDEIPTQDGPKHNKLETDSLDISSRDLDIEMNCDANVLKGTLNSDSSLKPCSSNLHPFDAASLDGQKLEENHLKTSEIERPSGGKNIEELSLQKQGEGIELMTDPGTFHISSDTLPLENSADHTKPDDLVEVVTYDAQFGSTFSASSEYPEPERMLLASTGGHDLLDDSEQGTSGKGTRELARTSDTNRNLSDEKEYLVEETPDLQNGRSVKVSGIARMKRKFDHIPDDDDLLASILVGRGASSLKLKSTPSPVTLSRRFMLLTSTSGLPLTHFVRQLCSYIASKILSSTYCFPLSLALFLFAKTLVFYSVACVYAGKKMLYSEFLTVVRNGWGRLVAIYICICGLLVSCLACFALLLITVCTVLSTVGYSPEVLVRLGFLVVLAFSIAYAHINVVCNVAGVVSVLEEGSGLVEALYRSVVLIRGQMQTGLLIFLGSTAGLCFVEWLFEHRVRTVSYGDGSSRIWEGPLLVLMHSFVVLVDCMMSAVFYFTCRSSSPCSFELLP